MILMSNKRKPWGIPASDEPSCSLFGGGGGHGVRFSYNSDTAKIAQIIMTEIADIRRQGEDLGLPI